MNKTITPSKKLRKLRSGNPVWGAYRVPRIPVERLTRDQRTDVVIIGAGISGAMMAEELSACGFSVIILDKGKPVRGSTAASTALLLYEIDNPLMTLSKQIGMESAIRVWRRSKLGLHNIAEKIQELEIECGMLERQSLYLAGDLYGAEDLYEECRLRNNIGLVTEYLSAKTLKDTYGIVRKAALKSFSSLELNPVQLAAGLLKKALERGTRIFSEVKAMDIDPGLSGVTVHTNLGISLKAKYAIFATGYEIPEKLKTPGHRISSTWVMATKPQAKCWPGRAFIWEASDPYLYLRTTADNRVICGGEDEKFSNAEERDALLPAKIKILQAKLKKLMPHLDVEAEYAWAGAFGASKTGLPIIGPVPGFRHCYAVMGYGGNGITFSKIAAELIRAELTGIEDPDRRLFEF